MNWYGTIKFSQILNVSHDTTNFEGQLMAFYEYEYKYSMLASKEFNGHPTRKENIANALKKQLIQLGSQIKIPILKTFEKWLASHAIFDPQQWAEIRTLDEIEREEDTMESVFFDILHEYGRFAKYWGADLDSSKEGSYEKVFSYLLKEIIDRIDKMPGWKEFLSQVVENQIEAKLELFDYDYEEFNEIFSAEFDSEDREGAGDLLRQRFTLDDAFDNIGEITDVINLIDNSGLKHNLLIEVNREFIFPFWFDYWKGEGIEETRENVEQAYEMLKDANPEDTGNFIVALNHALQVEHQTGSMLDYLQEETDTADLQVFLDHLSNKTLAEVYEWNQDLREIGGQI